MTALMRVMLKVLMMQLVVLMVLTMLLVLLESGDILVSHTVCWWKGMDRRRVAELHTDS